MRLGRFGCSPSVFFEFLIACPGVVQFLPRQLFELLENALGLFGLSKLGVHARELIVSRSQTRIMSCGLFEFTSRRLQLFFSDQKFCQFVMRKRIVRLELNGSAEGILRFQSFVTSH